MLTYVLAAISIAAIVGIPMLMQLLGRKIPKESQAMMLWQTVLDISKMFVTAAEEEIKGTNKGKDRYAYVEAQVIAELEEAGIPASNGLIKAAIHYAVSLLHDKQKVETTAPVVTPEVPVTSPK